jgi:hypothetical protein
MSSGAAHARVTVRRQDAALPARPADLHEYPMHLGGWSRPQTPMCSAERRR